MAERYLLPPEGTDYRSIDTYRAAGGYAATARALGELSPADVIEQVKESGLRGRGGAGFSTGQKWSFMPKPGGAKPSWPRISPFVFAAVCTFTYS